MKETARERSALPALSHAGPRSWEAALRPCLPPGRVGDTALSSPCGCELLGDLVPPLGGMCIGGGDGAGRACDLGDPTGQRALCTSVGQGHIK